MGTFLLKISDRIIPSTLNSRLRKISWDCLATAAIKPATRILTQVSFTA
jgi:hypothetical protein